MEMSCPYKRMPAASVLEPRLDSISVMLKVWSAQLPQWETEQYIDMSSSGPLFCVSGCFLVTTSTSQPLDGSSIARKGSFALLTKSSKSGLEKLLRTSNPFYQVFTKDVIFSIETWLSPDLCDRIQLILCHLPLIRDIFDECTKMLFVLMEQFHCYDVCYAWPMHKEEKVATKR